MRGFSLLLFFLYTASAFGQRYNQSIDNSDIHDFFISILKNEKDNKDRSVKINIGQKIIAWDKTMIKFYRLDSNQVDERILLQKIKNYLTQTDVDYLKAQIDSLPDIRNWDPKVFNEIKLIPHKSTNEISIKEVYKEYSIPIFTEDKLKGIALSIKYHPAGISYTESLYIKNRDGEWISTLIIYGLSS